MGVSGGLRLRAAGNLLQQARPCQEIGRDKINEAGGGRDSPRADPCRGGPECEYPCHQESAGQGRKGSADPTSGNFISPFASKGTRVLEFGQGGGVWPPWRNCVRVCVCMGVYLKNGVFV